MTLLGKGGFHETLLGKGNFVRKHPTSQEECEYEAARTSLEVHQALLGDFNPKTRVVQHGEKYCVIQRRIDGQTLHDLNETDLEIKSLEHILELLDVIEKVTYAGYIIDLYGKQETELYLPKKSGNKIIHLLKQLTYLKKYWDHYKDLFKSTNIMISEGGEVYFVDNVDERMKEKVNGLAPWKIMKLLMIQKYRYAVKKMLKELYTK